MPNGKKKKGHKMATHKRKKRLRRLTTVRRSKRNERSVSAYPTRMATHPFELKPIIKTSKRQ